MLVRLGVFSLFLGGLAAAAPPVVTWADGSPFSGTLQTPILRPFEVPLGATGGGVRFRAVDLPPGFAIDPDTGLISGTLAIREPEGIHGGAGEWQAKVWAENADGRSTPLTLDFHQRELRLGRVKDILVFRFLIRGPYVWHVSNALAASSADQISFAALPPGLSFDPTTATLSGNVLTSTALKTTMTVIQQGARRNFETLFWIQDPTAEFNLQGFDYMDPLSATVGDSVSYTVVPNPEPSFDHIGALALPEGLSLDPTTGVVSGRLLERGNFQTTFWTSGAGEPGRMIIREHYVLPPTVSRDGLPALQSSYGLAAPSDHTALRVVHKDFNHTGSTQLGQSWSGPTERLSSVGLPPGLSMAIPSGRYSGTVTEIGLFKVELTGRNAAGFGRAIQYLLVIDPSTAASYPNVAATFHARQGSAFSETLPVPSGATIHAANLPRGLSLDPASGALTGNPTDPGTTPVWFWTEDSGGPSSPRSSQIIVHSSTDPAATFLSGDLIAAPSGALPLAVETVGDYLGMTVTGAPGAYTAGAGEPSLSITDWPAGSHPITVEIQTSAGTASRAFSVLIDPALQTLGWDVVPWTEGYRFCPQQTPLVGVPIVPGAEGYPLSCSFTTDALPGATYAGFNLPPGLSIDAATGDVGGTPTQAGVFAAQVAASSPAGTAQYGVRFRIHPPQVAAEVFVGDDRIEKTETLSLVSGETTDLAAIAWGRNPSFQWYRDGIALSDGGGLTGTQAPRLQIAAAGTATAGLYELAVSSDDGQGRSTPKAISVVEGYVDWATRLGIGATGSETAPFLDTGLANLEAYAFGVDSAVSPAAPLEVRWISGQEVLTFTPPASVVGVTYALEYSDDLATWQAVGGSATEIPSATGAGVTLAWPLPAAATTSVRFYRVTVSTPS